ncbi:MAG: hypothetical protein ACREE6_01715 [Limisphaerales bacterium]
MGIPHIDWGIENPAKGDQSAVAPHVMVDTGSQAAWIDSSALAKIGIEPGRRDLPCRMSLPDPSWHPH